MSKEEIIARQAVKEYKQQLKGKAITVVGVIAVETVFITGVIYNLI